MNKKATLRSITLENFRSIRGRQELPLHGKINFLYGPNSAGKSSVRKACEILKYLFTGKNIFEGNINENAPLREWMSASSKSSSRIGVNFVIDGLSVRDGLKEAAIYADGAPISSSLEVGVEFALNTHTHSIEELIIHVDAAPLLCKELWGLSLNLDNRFLRHLRLPAFPGNKIASLHENAGHNDGWYSVESEDIWDMYDDFEVDDSPVLLSAKDEGEVQSYIEFCNSLIRALRSAMDYSWSLLCVPGNRTIPKREGLTYKFDTLEINEYHRDGDGNDLFLPMAADLAKKYLLEWHKKNFGHGFSKTSRYDSLAVGSQASVSELNRLFDEYLHIELGYQVDADIQLLLDTDALDGLLESVKNGDTLYFPPAQLIVELILRDSKGRRLSFDDVGSGVGYTLPIFAALSQPSTLLFIEQPELHLHPALQATLMDGLIEGVNLSGPSTLIVESHSEIALLRTLRRVRDFERGTYLNKTLGISADDVNILYFEPSSSDGTKVKTIRVSVDGDLLDRWPGGFFNERDEDIFQ